jgi:sulfoxide reductase heme-binding subunit YedZ
VAALLPLALMAVNYAQDGLTAEPIKEITVRTGRTALTMLVLSLACTPIGKALGFSWVLRLRRTLGLYAFFYAVLHLSTVVGLDYWFDFDLLLEDLAGKRFVWVGLAAFLMLLPLAITSTGGWKKRLGRNWQRLHWAVYPAALLAATHFALQVKADLRQPLIVGGIVILLLLVRTSFGARAMSLPRRLLLRKREHR